ncbi:MAG: PAS domain S-box protein [Acidobacteriota bacterium]
MLLVSAGLSILLAAAAFLGWRACGRARRSCARNLELEHELAAHRAEIERLRAQLAEQVDACRRAEDKFAASEQRYRELFDGANDLIYLHDLEGGFLAINKAAQRITGYTQEEAVRLNIVQLTAPEDVDAVRAMIARHLAGEPSSTYEVSWRTKSGVSLALELSTHLVFRGGNPVAVQGIARDVTERKRLEEQLRQSQKMEAVGQLAGGLAHDFNNLLTIVAAYSEMIGDESEANPRLRSYAEEILAAAERAGALTARLLAFGRRQMHRPQVLNLNELVSGMDNMLRRLIGEDVELQTHFDSRIGAIKADPGQVEQVIMNLAVNARDAMPRGGRLEIRTEKACLAGGGAVKLVVRDTGAGMTPEVKERIFEPFFTTKELGKGTGLGLSTVYGIVKQSGGEIAVESEPGKGSVFTIHFPVSEEAAPEVSSQSAEAGLRLRERVTVLLVEDEAGVRRLVRRMLVERGYRVLEASDGKEALAIYERQRAPVDLVLTDIVMPNMNGNELADRLRALKPSLKILFMTGYSEEAVLKHKPCSAPILNKPFLAEALDRKVLEALGAHER